MDAIVVYQEFTDRGFRFESEDGGLAVSPSDRLTDGDREKIRELVQHSSELSSRAVGEGPAVDRVATGVSPVVAGGTPAIQSAASARVMECATVKQVITTSIDRMRRQATRSPQRKSRWS